DVELQILLRLALYDAILDLDDRRGSVVRIDDRFANLKKHKIVSFRQPPEYHRQHALRFAPAASGGPRSLPIEWTGHPTAPGGSVKSRLVASAAISALVLLGATGCTFITPQSTEIKYSASDGINIPDSDGPLEIRNAMIIATEDGSTGNLVAAIVNPTKQAEVLTVELEGAEPLTVRVGAGDTLSLGANAEPLRIDDLDT